MKFSIVENLSGLSGNIFSLFRSPQLHFHQKSKEKLNYIPIPVFPLLSLFGVTWAAVIYL